MARTYLAVALIACACLVAVAKEEAEDGRWVAGGGSSSYTYGKTRTTPTYILKCRYTSNCKCFKGDILVSGGAKCRVFSPELIYHHILGKYPGCWTKNEVGPVIFAKTVIENNEEATMMQVMAALAKQKRKLGLLSSYLVHKNWDWKTTRYGWAASCEDPLDAWNSMVIRYNNGTGDTPTATQIQAEVEKLLCGPPNPKAPAKTVIECASCPHCRVPVKTQPWQPHPPKSRHKDWPSQYGEWIDGTEWMPKEGHKWGDVGSWRKRSSSFSPSPFAGKQSRWPPRGNGWVVAEEDQDDAEFDAQVEEEVEE